MPLPPVNGKQAWPLPPTLDDLLLEDHPARFVASSVDGLARCSGVPSVGFAQRLAVRVYDRHTIVSETGSGLPSPNPLPLAYRLAAS